MPENKPVVVYKDVNQDVLNSFEKAYSRTQDYTELSLLFPQLGDERGVQAAVEFINTRRDSKDEKELISKFPEFPGLKKKDSGKPSSMPTSKLPGDEVKVEKVDDNKTALPVVETPVPNSFWPQEIENVDVPDPVKPSFKLPENKAVSTDVKQTIFNTPIKGVLNKTLPTNDEQRLELYEKAIKNLDLRAKSKGAEFELLQKDFESFNQQSEQQVKVAQSVVKQQMDSKYQPAIKNIEKLYSSGKLTKEAADVELKKIQDSYSKEADALLQEKIKPIQDQANNKFAILKQKRQEFEQIRDSYKGIMAGVNATFLKRKIIAEGDNYLTDLKNVLNAGSSNVIASFMRTPAAVYDFSKAVTNKMLPETMQISAKGSEMFPNLEKTAKEWDEYGAMLAENARIKYQGSIEESYDKGNYLEAAAKTGLQIAESAPITLQIGMMMYNPGSGMQLSGILDKAANTKRLWNVFQFGGMKAKEMQKEFNLTDDQAGLLAVPLGITEQFFEETGTLALTGQLGQIIKKTLKEQGKEQAAEVAKKGFRAAFEKTFEKYYPVLGPLYEGVSEAETQFADNAIMRFSGAAPDLKLSEGVFDSFVTGTGTGVTMTTPVKVIEVMAQLMNRKALKSIEAKKSELGEVVGNPMSIDVSKQFAVDQIGQENAKINEVVGKTRDELQELSKEELDQVKPIVEQTQALEEVVNDPATPEPLKNDAEAKIEENLNILDSWLSNVKEKKAEVVKENEAKAAEEIVPPVSEQGTADLSGEKPAEVSSFIEKSTKDELINSIKSGEIIDALNKEGGTNVLKFFRKLEEFQLPLPMDVFKKLEGESLADEMGDMTEEEGEELQQLIQNATERAGTPLTVDTEAEVVEEPVKEEVQESIVEETPALKDVESTTKALKEINEKDKLEELSGLFFHGTASKFKNFIANKVKTGAVSVKGAIFFAKEKSRAKEFGKLAEEGVASKLFSLSKDWEGINLNNYNDFINSKKNLSKNGKEYINQYLSNLGVDNKIETIGDLASFYKLYKTSDGNMSNVKSVVIKKGAKIKVIDNVKNWRDILSLKGANDSDELLDKYKNYDALIFNNIEDYAGKGISKGTNLVVLNEDIVENVDDSNQAISEAYHKAKQDGSNPELVKAVEELLTNKQQETSVKKDEYEVGDKVMWEGEEREILNKTLMGKEYKYNIGLPDGKNVWTNAETINSESQKVGGKGLESEFGIKPKTPREILSDKGASLSEFLENFTDVYFPADEKVNEISDKLRAIKDKKSPKYVELEAEKNRIESMVGASQTAFLEELSQVIQEKADQLNVDLDEDLISQLVEQMTDGRYMEKQFNSMTANEYLESIINNYQDETNTGTEERSTETIIAESEAVRNEAEASESPEEIRTALQKLEDQINSIDAKVVKLTKTWDESSLPMDEQAGRQAGKAAKKEINKYAKELVRLLGWELKSIYPNIAPAGGDVVFRLSIPNTPLEVYVAVNYEPDYGNRGYENYKMQQFFYRVENPSEKGQSKYVGPNRTIDFTNKNWTANFVDFQGVKKGEIPTSKEFALILAKEAAPYIDKFEKESGQTQTPEQKQKLEEIQEMFEGKRTLIGKTPTAQKWGYTESSFIEEAVDRKKNTDSPTRVIVDEMISEMKSSGVPNSSYYDGMKADLVNKVEQSFRSNQLKEARKSLADNAAAKAEKQSQGPLYSVEKFNNQWAVRSKESDLVVFRGTKAEAESFAADLEKGNIKTPQDKINEIVEATGAPKNNVIIGGLKPTSKRKTYYQGIPKTNAYMQGIVDDEGNELFLGSINDAEKFKKENGIKEDDVVYVDLDTKNPNSLINKFFGFKELPESKPKVVEDDDKKAEIKAGIAEKMARLRKLTGGGLSSGVNLEALSLAIEITEDYVKLGYLKFNEIVRGIYEDYGVETLRDVYPAMKRAYGSFVYSQDTTVGYSATEDVQKFDLEKFIKDEQQIGKGANLSDGGTGSTTSGRDAGNQEEDSQPNDVGSSERMDSSDTIQVRPDVSGITTNPNAPTTGEPGSIPGNLRPEVNDSTIQHNFAYPADFVRNKNKTFSKSQAYDENIAALETLVEIMSQGNLYANEDQMKILSKYNGLGPLGEILLGDNEEKWKDSQRPFYDKSRRMRELIEQVGSLSKKRIVIGEPEYAQGDKVKFDSFRAVTGKIDKVIPAGIGTVVNSTKVGDDFEYTVNYSYTDENGKEAKGNFKFKESDLSHSGKNAQSTAERSTLSAYYTDLPIIRSMWSAVKSANFNHGRVLEGSVGSGRFIGGMPSSLRSTTQVTGVDMDVVSSLVAKYLYPKSKIVNSKLQNANVSPNTYDLFISNIPFADTKQYDAELYKKGGLWAESLNTLHGYYVAKALDVVRPGGLISIVSTSGLLDSPGNQSVRDLMHKEAEFIGAVRLPASTFNADAGTQVVTDIIMLRKRQPDAIAEGSPDFLKPVMAKFPTHSSVKNATEMDITFNQYFVNNPQNVFGEVKAGKSMYTTSGVDDYTIEGSIPSEDEINQLLSSMAKDFPIQPWNSNKDVTKTLQLTELGRVVGGGIIAKNGKFYRVVSFDPNTKNTEVEEMKPPAKADVGILESYIKARNLYFEILANDAKDINSDKQREELRNELTNFLKLISPSSIQSIGKGARAISRILTSDPDFYSISALIKNDGSFADVVYTPLKREMEMISTKDPGEAVMFSINTSGNINAALISKVMGIPETQVAEALKGFAFETIDGELIYAPLYLSGYIGAKIEQAKEWAQVDSKFQYNVDELEKVRPQEYEIEDIGIELGQAWIPMSVTNDFIDGLFGKGQVELYYNSTTETWDVKSKIKTGPYIAVAEQYGQEWSRGVEDVLDVAFNKKVPDLSSEIGPPGNKEKVKLTALQEALYEKANDILEQFVSFCRLNGEVSSLIKEIYNKINSIRLVEFDGESLTFPGMQGYDLARHQKNGIMTMIMNYGGMIDHEVGLGKTLVMCVGAIKMKQMGLVNRPVVSTMKSVVPGMVEQVKRQYPTAKILAPTESDFNPQNRQRLFAQITNNDWDLIILTHDNLNKIPLPPDFERDYINNEIEELDKALFELTNDPSDQRQKKAIEKRKENLEAALAKLLDIENASLINFGEMGIDFLMIDESQQFKNLPFITKLDGVKGLGTAKGSDRAGKLKMMTRYLQQLHGGDKGLLFASGTPISNSIVEVYNIFNYLRPTLLKRLGINSLDQFVTNFAKVEMVPSVNVAGVIKVSQRLNQFVNTKVLSNYYREISDVRNISNTYIERPSIKGGKPELVMVTPDERSTTVLDAMYQASETMNLYPLEALGIPNISGENKKKAMGLLLTGLGKKLAIDYRMIFPMASPPKSSKIMAMTDNIDRIYRETMADKGVQLIFSDLGTPKKKTATLGERIKSVLEDKFDQETLAEISGLQDIFKLKTTIDAEKEAIESLKNLLELDEEEAESIVAEANDFTTFNVYQEIKDQLINKGIPEEEIAFVHDADSEVKKEILFKKTQNGEIRVLLGSTGKLGTGVNVQNRVAAMHHLEMGWRPSDFEQRNGRGIRRGNMYKEVGIYIYGMEGSMDAFILNIVGKKQSQIDDFRNGTVTNAVGNVEGEAMSHLEMASALSGDNRLMDIENLKRKARSIRNRTNTVNMSNRKRKNDIEWSQRMLREIPEGIKTWEKLIEGLGIEEKEVEEPVFKDGVQQFLKDGQPKMEKKKILSFRANLNYNEYDTSKPNERSAFYKALAKEVGSIIDQGSKKKKKDPYPISRFYIGDVRFEIIGYSISAEIKIIQNNYKVMDVMKPDPINLRSGFTRSLKPESLQEVIQSEKDRITRYEKELEEQLKVPVLEMPEGLEDQIKEIEQEQAEIRASIDIDSKRKGTKIEKIKAATAEFVNSALQDVFRKTDVFTNVVMAPASEWGEDITGEGTDLVDGEGQLYGAYYNGTIYLNPDKISPDRPLHEYGHAFALLLKERAPEVFNRGLELIEAEGQDYIDAISSDPRYEDLSRKDLLEEALMRALADNGAKVATGKGLVFRNWLKEFWNAIKKFIGLADVTAEQLQQMSLKDFTDSMVRTMFDPEQITKLMERQAKKEPMMMAPKFAAPIKPSKFGLSDEIWIDVIQNLKESLSKGLSPKEAIDAAIDFVDAKNIKWKRNVFQAELASAYNIPVWARETKMRKSAKRIINQLPFSAETINRMTDNATYYTQIPKAVTAAEALKIVREQGLAQSQADVLDPVTPISNRVRVAMGIAIIGELGRLNRFDEQSVFMERMLEYGTDLGQAVDAFKMLGTMGVEGLVYKAIKDNKKMVDNWITKNQATINKLNDQMRGINREVAEQLINILAQQHGLVKPKAPSQPSPAKPAASKSYGEDNKVVTKSAYERAKAAMRGKFFSSPLPPELITMAAFHVEASGREFKKYVQSLVADTSPKILPLARQLYSLGRNELISNGAEPSTFLNDKELSADEVSSIIEVISNQFVTNTSTQSLEEELKANGLDVDQSKKAMEIIQNHLKTQAQEKKKELLNKYKGIKDVSEMVQLTNRPYSDAQFSKAFAKAFGKELSPDQISHIRYLATKVEVALSEAAKFRAIQELMNYQANLEGTDWTEVTLNLWYSSILSGPTTQEVNFGQTLINTLMEGLTQFLMNPKGGKLFARALWNGLSLGIPEAKDVLMTGVTPIRGKLETSTVLERTMFRGGNWNPFNWAKYVRRLMVASDVIFFEGLKEMRMAQYAYRLAVQEGRNQPVRNDMQRALEIMNYRSQDLEFARKEALELKKRSIQKIKDSELLESEKRDLIAQEESDYLRNFTEILNNRRRDTQGGDIVNMAANAAARGTYNNKPEGILGLAASVINGAKRTIASKAQNSKGAERLTWNSFEFMVNFVVPFTNVIANVFNSTIEYSPLGYIKAGSIKAETELERQTRVNEAYIKATIGTAAMVSLFVLTNSGDDDDDDAIRITANGTGDYKKNYVLKETGWQPYSIKVGGRWYSYQYSPFFLPLMIVGNMNDYIKYRDAKEVDPSLEHRLVWSMSKAVPQMFQSTFLQGLTDFTDYIMSEKTDNDLVDDALKGGPKMLAGFIPNLYKQGFNWVQEAYDIPEKDAKGFTAVILQEIPVARNTLFDKINVLGEQIIPDNDKFTSPQEASPLFELLVDKKAYLVSANRKSTLTYEDANGVLQERLMTDEEVYQYNKNRGSNMKQYLFDNYYRLDAMPQAEAKKEIMDQWERLGRQQKYILRDQASGK